MPVFWRVAFLVLSFCLIPFISAGVVAALATVPGLSASLQAPFLAALAAAILPCLAIGFLWHYFRSASSEQRYLFVPLTVNYPSPTPEELSSDERWTRAQAELDANRPNATLWKEALVRAEGNPGKARNWYLVLRFSQLTEKKDEVAADCDVPLNVDTAPPPSRTSKTAPKR